MAVEFTVGGGSDGTAAEAGGSSEEAAMPRDARIVKALLNSMGVAEYEPRVIHQFLELWYRYVVDILNDAQVYSDHAAKSTIDPDDVKLAIQTKVNFSFSQPPPREVLLELARNRNKIPLPKSIAGPGMPLPPEQDTLIMPNYQILMPKRQDSATAGEGVEEEEEEEGPNPNPNSSASSNPNPNPSSSQEQMSIDQPQQMPQKVSFPLAAGKRPR